MLTLDGKLTGNYTDLDVSDTCDIGGNTTIGGTATISGDTSIAGHLKLQDGTTGGCTIHAAEATADITAVATVTIQVNVPSNGRILGCQLRVDAALNTGETWNAQYVTGSTQSIATAQAVAQNTKVNKWFDVNTDTDIASAETDITIERSSNPGVDTFTAQGTIRAIVYYIAFDAMASL